jgi:hypothetical protein
LRAAGRATITVRGRHEEVFANEQVLEQRVAFFRDVYAPLVRSIPFGPRFVRVVDGVDIDPRAQLRRVAYRMLGSVTEADEPEMTLTFTLLAC